MYGNETMNSKESKTLYLVTIWKQIICLNSETEIPFVSKNIRTYQEYVAGPFTEQSPVELRTQSTFSPYSAIYVTMPYYMSAGGHIFLFSFSPIIITIINIVFIIILILIIIMFIISLKVGFGTGLLHHPSLLLFRVEDIIEVDITIIIIIIITITIITIIIVAIVFSFFFAIFIVIVFVYVFVVVIVFVLELNRLAVQISQYQLLFDSDFVTQPVLQWCIKLPRFLVADRPRHFLGG